MIWRLSGQAQDVEGRELGLLTDLYELTMAQCYFENGMAGRATFSLHVRTAPPDRGYMVCAGLEDVLGYLEEWSFSESDVEYLRGLGIFHEGFLDSLPDLRFTGDVWAMPEGAGVLPGGACHRGYGAGDGAAGGGDVHHQPGAFAVADCDQGVAVRVGGAGKGGERFLVAADARGGCGDEGGAVQLYRGAVSTSNVLAGRCMGYSLRDDGALVRDELSDGDRGVQGLWAELSEQVDISGGHV